MQTNTSTPKISGFVSKVIDKLMLTAGVIAILWIFAFLLVAIIEK